MIGCGTKTFTDPDDFSRHPIASISVVLTGSSDFKARLTWVNLRCLSLSRVQENVPRVAFIGFAPGAIVVSFPTSHHPPVIWNGVEMQPGEIVLHGHADRIHQRTSGASRWGFISLSPKVLTYYSRVLAHVDLTPAPATKFLQPAASFSAELRRLHAQACRLAETKPDRMAHKEVARAFEQDILAALINCLTAEETNNRGRTRQRHAKIMARFEDLLASHWHEDLSMPQICAAVGAQERAMRAHCEAFLGMSLLVLTAVCGD